MQEQRGETFLGLMLRSIVHEMKRQQEGRGAPDITLFDVLSAMRSPDSARRYKLLLARQFGDMANSSRDWTAHTVPVLISERNKVALKVLERTISQG